VLAVLAVLLVFFGRRGTLHEWAALAQQELNLQVGTGLIERLLLETVVRIGALQHSTVLGLALGSYSALEATEGVGLALRRRWAEYLTVIATSAGIPFEVVEVVHRPTWIRVAALVLNVAIVVYLSWRKRLLVGI
jgi:uncharacterized membrane protein (DUF2068 family)